MQERRLSSDWTWWYKRKSLLWSALLLLLGTAWLTWRFEIPLQAVLMFGTPYILAPLFLGFLPVRGFADEVEIVGNVLRVRRRGEEIRVALADVERVTTRGWTRSQINLELREPGRFGRTISFFPPSLPWRWTLSPDNPTAHDLRARIERARA
ncbi:hypothetical protein RDV84_15930 [Lysobacter yananisis]|uniref:PH domain-containing protein n=1 Tax=Lysobacter yananisis TaxID=1003114 RepID=A0ABY9P552_9GAMM|nr:hypothetical protein [Lysobacter yananisis]WMT01468.1 hypothetical protein RDV84_15930 [Lysobacter yananisis]